MKKSESAPSPIAEALPEAPVERLLAIMARLRDPNGGCPWDVEQTFATIAPHTIEEAYEVAEAIDALGAPGAMAHFKDELGDLLFQVVFYAQMASEAGEFGFRDVAAGVCEKMIRRHPHVFGGADIATAEAQTQHWEALKAEERKEKQAHGALDGVSTALPALLRAYKLQKRAARVGFDWPNADPVFAKFEEEVAELKAEVEAGDAPAQEHEVGDLLFTCVNLARKLGFDPETALRHANGRFETRFRKIEAYLEADGKRPQDTPLEDMEALWVRAKTEV